MNRIIVISGGSSGIGKQLVSLFGAAGDTVITLSRTNPQNAANHIVCDITDEAQVKAAVEEIAAKYGRINILINNAGKGISGATELLEAEKIREVIDTDYYGSLHLARECLKHMKSGDKIVNISSACALFALPYRGVYCSAKAAVNMMSFGLRMELDSCGIKVVCVCPGDIKTNFTQNRIKNYDTNDRYGLRVKNAADKIDSREHKRMDEIKASKKIYKIASKKTKALYIIGGKYKFLYILQRLVPTNLFIKITGKLFG